MSRSIYERRQLRPYTVTWTLRSKIALGLFCIILLAVVCGAAWLIATSDNPLGYSAIAVLSVAVVWALLQIPPNEDSWRTGVLKRKTVKNKKTIYGAVLLISLAATAVGGGITVVAVLTAAIAGNRWSRLARSDKNVIARDSAIKSLDMEMSGLRYLGSESTVYATRRLDLQWEPGPLEFEQLCRTIRGTWFKFRFSTINGSGRAQNFEISPITDADAQEWLERDRMQLMHEQGRLVLA